MSLGPSVLIGVRSYALNSIHTDNTPQFLNEGFDRLVDRSVQLGHRLGRFLEIVHFHRAIGSRFFDFPGCFSQLVTFAPNRVFVAKEISTVTDLTLVFLAENGFRFASGQDLDRVRSDQTWDDAYQAADDRDLNARLRHWFVHPSVPSLSEERFQRLWRIAEQVVKDAEQVPFGSLAYAISRYTGRMITLSPFAQLNSEPRGRRAIRYHRRTADGPEEFILYAPANGLPSSLDFWTRYSVAHELAHVALDHRPGDGTQPQAAQEEVEAHYLAAVILTQHGAPTQRDIPSDDELHSILSETDLSPLERSAVIDRLRAARMEDADPLATFFANDFEGSVSRDPDKIRSCRGAVARAIKKYDTDSAYRERVNAEILQALDALR